MSSDYLYVQRRYATNRIDTEKPFSKGQWNGEDWWNGVSLSINGAIQHKCSRCQRDTQLFYRLRKEGKDVNTFEDGYKTWMKNRTSFKVECTLNCFWYDYFQRARGIKSPSDNNNE